MLENINKKYNINETETLVVGTSAGPDSMALLHYLKNNTNNPIICCHINHNVRKESIEEGREGESEWEKEKEKEKEKERAPPPLQKQENSPTSLTQRF